MRNENDGLPAAVGASAVTTPGAPGSGTSITVARLSRKCDFSKFFLTQASLQKELRETHCGDYIVPKVIITKSLL